jgi:hypothetical protein
MPHSPIDTTRKVPTWLLILGSVAIFAHLVAIAVMVLAAPSGPWASPFGMSMALAPQFAQSGYDVATPAYLRWIKMTHNYHFPSNRPGAPGVYLEVKLKDSSGKIIETLKFPDNKANAFVRHRQLLLARQLADDTPLPPRQGEVVAAPGRAIHKTEFWDMPEAGKLHLKALPDILVPRDRPVFRPSDWSMVLVKSYTRYLCRSHGAAKAEVIRHTKDPVPPIVLYLGDIPAGAFDELVSNYGDLPND